MEGSIYDLQYDVPTEASLNDTQNIEIELNESQQNETELNEDEQKQDTDIKVILSSFAYEIENGTLVTSPGMEPSKCLIKYSVEIDVTIDGVVIHSRRCEISDKCDTSFLFDFVKYFGTAKFNFKLIKSEIIPNCIMSSNKLSVIGRKSVYLYEIFEAAKSPVKFSDSWYQYHEISFYCTEHKSMVPKESKIQSIVDKSSFNKWFRKLSLSDIDVASSTTTTERPTAAYTFHLKFHTGIISFQNVPSSLRTPPNDGTDYICLHKLVQDTRACNKDVICDLLSSFSNKHILNRILEHEIDGNTLLDTAIVTGNYVVVRALLKRAGSLCFVPLKQHTKSSLHKAVLAGNYDIFTVLLLFLRKYYKLIENWRDKHESFEEIIEWIDDNGNSPLLQACLLPNRTQYVSSLLYNGANCAMYNRLNRRTCFMHAAIAGEISYFKHLLRQQVHTISYPSALPRLSRYKCLPLETDINGDTVMHLAVKHYQLETAQYLYKLGMYHPLLNNFNKENNSLVHLAVMNHSRTSSDRVIAMTQLALQVERKSFLLYQKKNSYKSVIDTMVSYRKVIFALNNQGETPLTIARVASTDLYDLVLRASRDIYGDTNCADSIGIAVDNEINLTENDQGNSDDYAFALSPAKSHAQY